jgi:hypothetical protein
MIGRLVRAGLLTAILDGLFSSVLAQFFYGSSATRMFQGVAATLIGMTAIGGGTRTAVIGVLMHIGVAFGWSAVFLLAYSRIDGLRRATTTAGGIVSVAAVYGPMIWLIMSLVMIPVLLHRPPAFGFRWAVQLAGHVIFVGLPIVWSIAHPSRRPQPALSGAGG